jgi:hypothetical protein
MMKQSLKLIALASLLTLALGGALSLATVEARPEPKNEKAKAGDPAAWSDPLVQGIVMDTFWVEGKNPKQQTAVIQVWSNESDLAVIVYGDNPAAREAIVSGTACVGRFVIAVGDRIDEDELSADGIEVPNLDMACTKVLQ